jgi:hypothetical protein
LLFGAPSGPELIGNFWGAEKNVQNLNWVLKKTLQIRNTLPIDAGCIVVSIYWSRNAYIYFLCVHSSLSLYFHFLIYLRLPLISISIALTISVFLPFLIFISLRVSKQTKIIPIAGAQRTICCDRLLIRENSLFLGGTGENIELKTTSKLIYK